MFSKLNDLLLTHVVENDITFRSHFKILFIIYGFWDKYRFSFLRCKNVCCETYWVFNCRINGQNCTERDAYYRKTIMKVISVLFSYFHLTSNVSI